MLKRLLGPIVLALVVAACTSPTVSLEVTSVTPAADAIDVPVDTTVSAVFGVAIDPDSVEGNFTLAATGGAAVTGVATYVEATRTAIFTPAADLAYGTEYTATVAGEVATVGGVQLDDDVSWSFTTEADPDPDPAVTSVTIDQGDLGLVVGADATLTATVAVVGGAGTTVVWSSSDESIATVSAAGLVEAVAAGSAEITATSAVDANQSDTVTVTVADPLVVTGDYAAYAADADVNVAIDLAFPAITGGTAPFTFELVTGALPEAFLTQEVTERGLEPASYALTLDAATGAVTGATGFPGVFTGSVQVTDAIGQQATAAFALDLELTFRYTAADLVTTQTTFSYPIWVEPGPYVIVPGDRVQVSGVEDTLALPVGFLDDLLFELTYVSSNGTPSEGEIASFEINAGQGAVSQVAEVATVTEWFYDVEATHGPSGKTATVQLNFEYAPPVIID